jgi:TDG/mug DNA glycosylase family protein
MSHRVVEEWMGESIETLADLLPAEPRAICVGSNPSPISVAEGHYYRGPLGKLFFRRLRSVGLLAPTWDGFEDDAAFASGVGFTDVVKRPTSRATGVTRDELRHGAAMLDRKLRAQRTPLVIFTYKVGAEQLFGRFAGHGFVAGLELAGSTVFVMPGPMERTDRVDLALAALREHLSSR